MSERDRSLGWHEALIGFIFDNGHFPRGREGPSDPPATRALLLEDARRKRGRRVETEGRWALQADLFAWFTHRAPLLQDLVAPIAYGPANLSTAAWFDPLTLQGYGDVDHLFRNRIMDDSATNVRRGTDGAVRLVDRDYVEEDLLRHPGDDDGHLPDIRLDRPRGGLRTAERHPLLPSNARALLIGDLTSAERAVPDAATLMALAMARPYDDR